MDDLSVYSIDIAQMLDDDLPHSLAICSTYNILLSPQKAELVTDSLRVLGFEVAEGVTGISSEKLEKIKSLTFPKTKDGLVSVL